MTASPSRRGRLGLAGLVLASCAAGLVLAEGLVRRLLPQPIRVAWEDEWEGLRVPRPNVRGRHRVPGAFDVRVSINGQRFRGAREYPLRPASGVRRIAVLGDSMTFGWGAADSETYPAQLEALLSDRASALNGNPGAAQAAVEVINAGYPGTCLGEKAAWYERGVRPFHPSLVILTLLGDDVDGDLFWRVFSLDPGGRAVPNAPSARGPAPRAAGSTRAFFQSLPGYELLAERSQLFALVRKAVTRAASRERTTALGRAPATAEEAARFRGEGLALLQAELRWLRDRTKEDQADLVVVLVPFRESVYPDGGWWADELRWKTSAVAESAAAACRAMDVPFRDVTPALVARARSAPSPLYHAGSETHPTPAGYRAIAEEVAAFLAEP
jgi:lysophospholipase L1-like esterase